jgi:ribosomal protein L20
LVQFVPHRTLWIWNRNAAARRLGISFRALRYRLGKLGIE